jgi:hypothetical protein
MRKIMEYWLQYIAHLDAGNPPEVLTVVRKKKRSWIFVSPYFKAGVVTSAPWMRIQNKSGN